LNAIRADKKWHDGSFTHWSEVRDAGHPCPAGAGEIIGVASRELAPWDAFTTDLNASPIPPSESATTEGAEEVERPEEDGA
jgi:hypothetical protein